MIPICGGTEFLRDNSFQAKFADRLEQFGAVSFRMSDILNAVARPTQANRLGRKNETKMADTASAPRMTFIGVLTVTGHPSRI